MQRNIEAYAFVIPATYAIYWRWQRRKEFWIVFFTILLLPPMVSAVFDYSILHIRHGQFGTTVGFSGIANGYAGMLLGSVGLYIAHRTSNWSGFGLVLTTYCMGSWVILDNLRGLTIPPMVLLLLGMIVGVFMTTNQFDFKGSSEVRDAVITHAFDVGLIGYAIIITASIAAGFPADAGEEGVNISAHIVGVIFGFLVVGGVWCARERPEIPW